MISNSTRLLQFSQDLLDTAKARAYSPRVSDELAKIATELRD